MRCLRLVLDRVRLESLELAEGALLQLAFVYDMVGLLGEHALDEVDRIVEDDTESLDTSSRVVHGLDLDTLNHRVDDVLAGKDAAKTARCDDVHRVGHGGGRGVWLIF